MRRSIPLAFIAAAVLAAVPLTIDRNAASPIAVSAAQAAVDVNINLFFTSLAPHGSWIPSDEYNYIWVPTNVDKDWSPYTNGRWIYTQQYGWYFVSDEPFAWVVYHYGRWGYDPQIGWYWVPGTKFAGAWVAWRRSNNAVAWAPLPPQGRGYATSVNVTINIGSVPQFYWRVVQVNNFLAPQLRTVAFVGTVRTDLFAPTQPAGTVIVQNNIVVNNVININFIEQQTKQKVEVAKLETVSDPQQATASGGTAASIKAFVADLAPPPATEKPAKVVAKAEVAATAPTKGQAEAQATTAAAQPAPTQPNAAPANPRCTDADFAKANPKDCAPSNTAGNAATTTPPNNATPPANTATGNAGTTTPPNNGKPPANTATAPGNATTPPAATGNVNANANANAKAGAPTNPRCADPAYARNNPKTCAPAAAAGTSAGTGANATVTPPATSPANNTATNAPGRNTPAPGNANADAQGKANATANAPKAPTPGKADADANANANANVTTAPGARDPRCGQADFARNNPRTCGTAAGAPATTGANANAAATGNTGSNTGANATAGGNANGRPAATAAAPAASAGGNVTVQGNSRLPDPRCTDMTFARNSPNICRPNANAGANAGAAAGAGTSSPSPQ